jgi:hypothetical protein
MSEATDFLVLVRDEAGTNVAALVSVRQQVLDRCNAIAAWPESPIRTDMLKRFNTMTRGIDKLLGPTRSLQKGANDAAVASGGVVPPSPIPAPNPGGITWSTDTW